MAFQLSAGVNVSEIDLTTVVPSVASSTGAFAGKFSWGPVNEITTISDEVRLIERFGRPTEGNYEYWFSAANFLAYSNNLKVVRAANSATTRNATANGGILIENETEGRDRRIILRATQYTDGDNLRIKHQPDENIPANFTLLPINQVLDKGEKASSEKFVQKINVEYEILINEDDEIKIRVIDAGIFYKFTINETVLDEMPREEVLS